MKSDNAIAKDTLVFVIEDFFAGNIYDIIPQSSCSNKVVMIKSKLSVENVIKTLTGGGK